MRPMKTKISTAITFLIFGFVLALFLFKSDLTPHKENIEIASNTISTLFTTIAAIVGIYAFNTWKIEAKDNHTFQILIELESNLAKLLLLSVNEKKLNGCAKYQEFGDKILDYRLKLQQREFDKNIVDAIELSMRDAIQSALENGYFKKEKHQAVLDALNKLSEKINTDYGTNNK